MNGLVDDQVRLVLEQQCSTLFDALMRALPRDATTTLVLVDYGEPGRFKNVAFKTALQAPLLVATVEAQLQRWRCGSAGAVLYDQARHGWVPGEKLIAGLGRLIKERVPAGVGFVLMFGQHDGAQYLSTCDRAGKREAIQFGKTRVLAKTVQRVERFYQKVMN